MSYLNLEKLVSYDSKQILNELKMLRNKLQIVNEFDVSYSKIDRLFLKGLEVDVSLNNLKKQLVEVDKIKPYLELYYRSNGKLKMLKSFGKIEYISDETIELVYKYVLLIKLLKNIEINRKYAAMILNTKNNI